MGNEGYIRLSRKFFKNEYWTKRRSYSQAEAWLDLIQMARFEAEPIKKALPNGRLIVIERGEIHASLRFLSARWDWGLMQVRTFLRNAVETHQITQRVTQGENVITLCKYDDYNPLILQNNTPDNTPNNTPITHRQHTDNTNLKKEKKEKKEKESKIEKDISNDISKKTFDFGKILISDYGCDKQHVGDWLKVRKTKKASNTETALNRFIKECKDNDFEVSEAVKICAERSWQGFKAEWVKNTNNSSKSLEENQLENINKRLKKLQNGMD